LHDVFMSELRSRALIHHEGDRDLYLVSAWHADDPPFGEATLADFRARLVRTGKTGELLRRTVDLARETKGFGFKQAAGLRIAVDSAPLDGAGKVEDTINLLGRSLRLLLQVIAAFLVMTPEEVAAQAHLPVLVAPSIKAGLDLDWHEPGARDAAVGELVAHMKRLTEWIERRFASGITTIALEAAQRQVDRIVAQDLEPDGKGGQRIREGVAEDRQISISDPDMRHGRFARYRGVANNDFDSLRIAAMNNLHTIDRRLRRAGVEEGDEAS
jgi:hypothetical protein